MSHIHTSVCGHRRRFRLRGQQKTRSTFDERSPLHSPKPSNGCPWQTEYGSDAAHHTRLSAHKGCGPATAPPGRRWANHTFASQILEISSRGTTLPGAAGRTPTRYREHTKRCEHVVNASGAASHVSSIGVTDPVTRASPGGVTSPCRGWRVQRDASLVRAVGASWLLDRRVAVSLSIGTCADELSTARPVRGRGQSPAMIQS